MTLNSAIVPEVGEAGAGRVLPLSTDGFATAIREMLTDRAGLQEAGRRAAELARHRFAATSVVSELESLYASVAANR